MAKNPVWKAGPLWIDNGSGVMVPAWTSNADPCVCCGGGTDLTCAEACGSPATTVNVKTYFSGSLFNDEDLPLFISNECGNIWKIEGHQVSTTFNPVTQTTDVEFRYSPSNIYNIVVSGNHCSHPNVDIVDPVTAPDHYEISS